MVNDSAPPLADFAIYPNPCIEYVLGRIAGRPVAVFLLCGSCENRRAADVHFSALPETWGVAAELVSGFLKWVWANTPLDSLVARVPSYNRLCLSLAGKVGFERREVIRAGQLRRGKSFDLIQMQIARPPK